MAHCNYHKSNYIKLNITFEPFLFFLRVSAWVEFRHLIDEVRLEGAVAARDRSETLSLACAETFNVLKICFFSKYQALETYSKDRVSFLLIRKFLRISICVFLLDLISTNIENLAQQISPSVVLLPLLLIAQLPLTFLILHIQTVELGLTLSLKDLSNNIKSFNDVIYLLFLLLSDIVSVFIFVFDALIS